MDDELVSIGEFARAVGISPSALRFYDDCGLLAPMATDPASGYRRYGRTQIEAAVLLRDCRQVGMPLELVRRILTDPAGADELIADYWRGAEADLATKRRLVHDLQSRLGKGDNVMATWTVGAAQLRTGLGQVASSAAPPGSERVVLQSILVELGEELRLVATDSYRLAMSNVVVHTAGDGAKASALVAPDLAAAFARQLPDAGEATIDVGDGMMRFSAGNGVELAVPSDSASYPDSEQILSALASRSGSALVPAAEFLGVLEQLQHEVLGELQVHPVVGFEVRDNELTLGGLEGTPQFTVACRSQGAPVRTAFNPMYLIEPLRFTEGPDVLIETAGPLDPILLRSAVDGTFTAMVMPVRLKDPPVP